MKRTLLFALFLYSASIAQAQNFDIITKGQQAPDFVFNSENGKTEKLSDLKGKVVLINFFATWCGPCNQELPILQKNIWQKQKNNPNFKLLIIGRGHNTATLDSFKVAKKFDLPMYPDKDKSIFKSFAVQNIPRNYIIDKEGKVVYASSEFTEKEFAEMTTFLEGLLK